MKHLLSSERSRKGQTGVGSDRHSKMNWKTILQNYQRLEVQYSGNKNKKVIINSLAVLEMQEKFHFYKGIYQIVLLMNRVNRNGLCEF